MFPVTVHTNVTSWKLKFKLKKKKLQFIRQLKVANILETANRKSK